MNIIKAVKALKRGNCKGITCDLYQDTFGGIYIKDDGSNGFKFMDKNDQPLNLGIMISDVLDTTWREVI